MDNNCNLFFVETLTSLTNIIEGNEFKHLKALRVKEQDFLYLTNGNGALAKGRLLSYFKENASIEIISFNEFKNPILPISIAIAPTKNIDRIEWFIEKAIEVGIENIYLYYAKSSVRKTVNIARLQSIAISAIKQSKRIYLPTITEFTNLKEVLNYIKEEGYSNKFIAHCFTEDEKIYLKDVKLSGKKEDRSIVLIGPEGDFTKEEIDYAKSSFLTEVSLGEAILRTETAGLTSLIMLQCKY